MHLASGCGKPAATTSSATAAPAKSDKIAQEEELNTIELSPAAAERLGIKNGQRRRPAAGACPTVLPEIALPPRSHDDHFPAGRRQAPSPVRIGRAQSRYAGSKGQPILLNSSRCVLRNARCSLPRTGSFCRAKNAVATARIDSADKCRQIRGSSRGGKNQLESRRSGCSRSKSEPFAVVA